MYADPGDTYMEEMATGRKRNFMAAFGQFAPSSRNVPRIENGVRPYGPLLEPDESYL